MKIAVIGTGYVGLTTGAALAHIGHAVSCVDVDEEKVQQLRQGICPIYEPGLDDVLAGAKHNLRFTTSCREAVQDADVVFIAVGTPSNPDGSPNLKDLFGAVNKVLDNLGVKSTPTLLVNKSTVPVGTGDRVAKQVGERGLGALVEVASNPEFLRQGRALADTLYPDRVVVGGSEQAARILQQLYRPILERSFAEVPASGNRPFTGEVPFIHVDIRSAELAKYAANSFLAMKISFINEMANVCDCVGADVELIARIIGTDPRIGPAFLQAGIGYGGSCFPKDTRALHYMADTNGYDFKLLSAVIEVNNAQRFVVLDKLKARLGNQLAGRKIAVLGLSFKPDTDDLRDAPSLPIIGQLVAEGARVHAHDPVAMEKAARVLPPEVALGPTLAETVRGADAALLLTEWPEYREMDADWLIRLMNRPLLIDGRNAYPKDQAKRLIYAGIGRQHDCFPAVHSI